MFLALGPAFATPVSLEVGLESGFTGEAQATNVARATVWMDRLGIEVEGSLHHRLRSEKTPTQDFWIQRERMWSSSSMVSLTPLREGIVALDVAAGIGIARWTEWHPPYTAVDIWTDHTFVTTPTANAAAWIRVIADKRITVRAGVRAAMSLRSYERSLETTAPNQRLAAAEALLGVAGRIGPEPATRK